MARSQSQLCGSIVHYLTRKNKLHLTSQTMMWIQAHFCSHMMKKQVMFLSVQMGLMIASFGVEEKGKQRVFSDDGDGTFIHMMKWLKTDFSNIWADNNEDVDDGDYDEQFQNKHGQELDLQLVCVPFNHQNFLDTLIELIIKEDLAICFVDLETIQRLFLILCRSLRKQDILHATAMHEIIMEA
ncbi:hypothetical protein L218DRAFT_950540 [Marasmius fiardii PR-910]|nr:hypothetical protein L218DRAFT_950540 [Marasmius fiardii PR-910]